MSTKSSDYVVKPGYIYVIQQQVYSPYYKIGWTGDVANRRRSLDTTGVPVEPLVLWYDYVSDPIAVEKESHRRLAAYRVRGNREWFQLEPAFAIKTVIEVSVPYTLSEPNSAARVDITHRLRERFGSIIRQDLQQASVVHTATGVVLETLRRNVYLDAFITHRVLSLSQEDRQTGADFRAGGTAEENAIRLLSLDAMTLVALYGDLTG